MITLYALLLRKFSSSVPSPGGSVTSEPQQQSALTSPTATSFVRGRGGRSSWRVVPHVKQPDGEQAKEKEEDEEAEEEEEETAGKRKSK